MNTGWSHFYLMAKSSQNLNVDFQLKLLIYDRFEWNGSGALAKWIVKVKGRNLEAQDASRVFLVIWEGFLDFIPRVMQETTVRFGVGE